MKKINQTVEVPQEEPAVTTISPKQKYAVEIVAEFLISKGWQVYTSVNSPEAAFGDMFCIRGALRPSFINVIVRNKTKVPESQAMSEDVRQKIIDIKEKTTYTVYTFFIDELCGDVYGVNGKCPPDFTRGKSNIEAFWKLNTMRFMFKVEEEKRKLLRALNYFAV